MSLSLATRSAARSLRPQRSARPSLLQRLLDWQQRAFQRHALWRLSDYDLKDIGLSRADVEAEATKPFWRS